MSPKIVINKIKHTKLNKFSRKQLKIIPMSSNKHLPWKFNCGFARSSFAWTNKQRQKNTRQDLTTNTEGKKNKIKDNKPYVLSVLHHIFVIFSSQISTMIETSDAILEYETTNWRWENNPRDIRFPIQSSTIQCTTVAPITDIVEYRRQVSEVVHGPGRGSLFIDFKYLELLLFLCLRASL